MPETLTITAEELRFLRRLAPLVDTPRAAKRLVNTYQLLRVSVDDVPDFLTRKEYEPLLILLALVTRSPGLTAPMIRSLLASQAGDLSSFLRDLDPVTDDEGTEGWRRLAAELAEIAADRVTAHDVRQWMPAVSRFSFRPGLLAAALSSPSAPRGKSAPDETTTLPGGRPDAEPSTSS
jgi:hypothetical protein